ncbi:MAG: ABC transporter substrate-binding protein, partial [Rhodobacteraceae bacterium]|nr:ABC transporter substrate-binding protein [Paracoccaceae bacterium]
MQEGLWHCRWTTGCALLLAMFTLSALPAAAQDVPGVGDGYIIFGQTATFSGPAAELGKEVRLGIEAAFNQVNSAGGVHGRELRLRSLDDKYEPNNAITNVRQLLGEYDTFALVGGIGEPTARAVAPIVEAARVPYVAPFTGAGFLRDRSRYRTIINLRTSYEQEVIEIVERLTQDRGISRIGIVYQEDSFGRSGLESAEFALRLYGLTLVARGTFPRNTTAVKSAVFDLMISDPEAVILIGAYRSIATMVRWSNAVGFKPVFASISAVGGVSLSRALEGGAQELYMTQTTPS